MKHPTFPELSTTTVPELFGALSWNCGPISERLLKALASRWHDPNCECTFKVTGGGQLVEKEPCMRCENVRRMIRERL